MKIVKYKEQAIEDFTPPQRVYSDTELLDFHQKIQKFWHEPREVVLANGMSGIAQKFDHEALAVAFGAAIKVKHGEGYVYLYNERNTIILNLWKQYEDYRRRQDWGEGKRVEELQKMAEEVPF